MNQKTFFVFVGTFFLADVIFHLIRLAVWQSTGLVMEFPLWITPIAIIFNGFLAWQALRLYMQR